MRRARPPWPDAGGAPIVALVCDRLGWEERRLLDHLPSVGLRGQWINDESLCLGRPKRELPGVRLAVIRSRSYVRGGLLATLLDAAGIPTLNRPEAIRVCENKLDLLHTLAEAGLPVPAFRLVLSRRDVHRACEELGLPLVLKPLHGGGGRRVVLIRERDTLDCLYDCVDDLGHGFERACLAEPYLPGSCLRSLVVGQDPVATVRFAPGTTEWRSNAATGGRPRFCRMPDSDTLVRRVAQVLGPGFYGVDLFATQDGYVVGEVNHAPGYRALASVAPVDVTGAIAAYLREAVA